MVQWVWIAFAVVVVYKLYAIHRDIDALYENVLRLQKGLAEDLGRLLQMVEKL